ncbi:Hypothetical predicted protein [Pelobates cultripes]|uniref:Uncharacterized protein n=1 Tax=Pelobates cultripes TaxID=61616 RepID=A0AAD1WJB0_PELCU|nr:Hypothetical predicted protein [Pelobates cultripes]
MAMAEVQLDDCTSRTLLFQQEVRSSHTPHIVSMSDVKVNAQGEYAVAKKRTIIIGLAFYNGCSGGWKDESQEWIAVEPGNRLRVCSRHSGVGQLQFWIRGRVSSGFCAGISCSQP